MDNDIQVERARAVLGRLRDQLLDHQQRQPNPGTFVPADLAELFNDTLADLEGVYGALWVGSVSISQWAIVPASTRVGDYPSVALVNRETLLSRLGTVLRRLNTDVRLRQEAPSMIPNNSATTANPCSRSLHKSST
jgi:hypothetical protein